MRMYLDKIGTAQCRHLQYGYTYSTGRHIVAADIQYQTYMHTQALLLRSDTSLDNVTKQTSFQMLGVPFLLWGVCKECSAAASPLKLSSDKRHHQHSNDSREGHSAGI
jgi:hypothetical protein